jgi:hypothetical protein
MRMQLGADQRRDSRDSAKEDLSFDEEGRNAKLVGVIRADLVDRDDAIEGASPFGIKLSGLTSRF